jgi:nitrate reductase gamma subunit
MYVLAYIVAYATIIVFVVAVIARFAMWSRMPMHLRWELYPVAHEGKRARYGGSYLEEYEWWKKPREVSLVAEARAMFMEIVFLVALREHNRRHWNASFPFHFGLYLMIGATVLMMAGGVLRVLAPGWMAGALGGAWQAITLVLAVAGLVLGLLGALGLLFRRLAAPELKDFTSGADIFNLVFFVVALGCALATFLAVDRDFRRIGFFVDNLVTFRMAVPPGSGMEATLPALSAILLGVLLAYIPLTHMSHFVGKYFAYHAIRWNDEPNLPGGEEEATIEKLLNQPVGWSAPHIQSDGQQKTWAEAASDDLTKEPKK